MPQTYEPIATTTLGSAAATITFSSIPSTYTDLRLVLVGSANTSVNLQMTFNNDTATNYSSTNLIGTGASAISNQYTGFANIRLSYGAIDTTIGMATADIFSYTGSTNKTVLTSYTYDQNGAGYVDRKVALWRSTSAINRIDISVSSFSMNAGTTATLYGILKA